MIHLQLDENEKEALSSALKSYLSDLGDTIAGTDEQFFRDQLKAKRAFLQEVPGALVSAADP